MVSRRPILSKGIRVNEEIFTVKTIIYPRNSKYQNYILICNCFLIRANSAIVYRHLCFQDQQTGGEGKPRSIVFMYTN